MSRVAIEKAISAIQEQGGQFRQDPNDVFEDDEAVEMIHSANSIQELASMLGNVDADEFFRDNPGVFSEVRKYAADVVSSVPEWMSQLRRRR